MKSINRLENKSGQFHRCYSSQGNQIQISSFVMPTFSSTDFFVFFFFSDALPKRNAKENGGTARQIDRSVLATTQIVMSQNISLAHIAVPDLFAMKKLSPTPARFIGRISLNNKSPVLNILLLVCLLTNINSSYP